MKLNPVKALTRVAWVKSNAADTLEESNMMLKLFFFSDFVVTHFPLPSVKIVISQQNNED